MAYCGDHIEALHGLQCQVSNDLEMSGEWRVSISDSPHLSKPSVIDSPVHRSVLCVD